MVAASRIVPRSLIGGGINRCFCLTSVVAYIGPNSRTRPRKTKIGTEISHVSDVTVTLTPLSMPNGQRSRSPGRFTQRGLNA